MVAVTSIEQDIMQLVTTTVDGQIAIFRNSSISRPVLIQAAAAEDIGGRLTDIQNDENVDDTELLIITVVQNRIVQRVGIWSSAAITDFPDEMLLDEFEGGA